jgi:hypothetical protein
MNYDTEAEMKSELFAEYGKPGAGMSCRSMIVMAKMIEKGYVIHTNVKVRNNERGFHRNSSWNFYPKERKTRDKEV